MSQTAAILDLLKKLHTEESYFSRMKLISKLWETFSKLSPKDRTKMLVALGLDGAQGTLDKFLANPGTYYYEILDLADSALKRLSPEHLQNLSRGHLSSEDSEMILDAIRESVEEEVREESASVRPPDPPGNGKPRNLEKKSSGAVIENDTSYRAQRKPIPLIKEVDGLVTSSKEEDIQEPLPDSMKPAELSEEQVSAESETETEPAADEKMQVSGKEKISTPFLFETDRGVIAWENIEDQEVQIDSGGSADFSPVDIEIPAVETPVRLYWKTTRNQALMEKWSVQELRENLNRFPSGWMKRRILTRYLESNSRLAIDQKLMQVLEENTNSPTDYLWYAKTLIRNFQFSDSNISLILDFAPTPMIRRSLEKYCESKRESKENETISKK